MNQRRDFLKQSAAISAASITASRMLPARANDALKPLNVGLIGCGGRGNYLAGLFKNSPSVKLSWLCDANEKRLGSAISIPSEKPKTCSDMREMLDDDDLDAVIVATPDHWHSPAAILACDAGKHVYVEKPCSHNVREGRLLVEAAKRNNVIVQHGTQVRSTTMLIDAMKLLRDGIIGDVKVVKAWNIQRRGNIGHQQPSDPPDHLDYDLWVGPCEMIPYQNNRVNNGWHWWYHFGTGDMGNDGVHDIDYARWALGVETHPSKVTAVGGKYFFDDDQEFPDTQQVAFEYPGDGETGSQRILIYEQRLWSTNYPHNTDSGVEVYGTKGQMYLSRRGKIQVLGERNAKIDVDIAPEAQNAPKHVANFLDCVRTGKTPNADIDIGHLTSSLCHLGNIAVRLGRSFDFDPATESVPMDQEVNELLGRRYREHWGNPVA